MLNRFNIQFNLKIRLDKIKFRANYEYNIIDGLISPVIKEIRQQLPSPYFTFLWMLDELGDIINLPWCNNACTLLRALLYSSSLRNDVTLLLAGKPDDFDKIISYGSPLENILSIYELTVLKKEKCTEWLAGAFNDNEIESGVIAEIFRQTGGHPYLIHTILEELLIKQNLQKITLSEVQKSVQNFIQQDTIFNEWYQKLNETDLKIYQQLLDSGKTLPATDFRHLAPPGGFYKMFRRLRLMGLIRPSDDYKFYTLNMDMFRQWFIANR